MYKRILLAAVAILLVLASGYTSFFVAPTERTMGDIQRIFYFHVGSAWAGMDAFFVCFICNLLYVWKRKTQYDWLAVSSAEVGLVLTTVVLITGPIWAKPVWGIWWTWDARLTLTFVLWLLFVAYLMLRSYVINPGRSAVLGAVVGIIGFVDVPVDYMAIRWWRTQHPQPVIAGGSDSGLDPRMWVALLVTWGAFLCLFAYLMRQYLRLAALRREVAQIQRRRGRHGEA